MFSDIILNLFNEGRFQQGKKIIEIGGAVSNYVIKQVTSLLYRGVARGGGAEPPGIRQIIQPYSIQGGQIMPLTLLPASLIQKAIYTSASLLLKWNDVQIQNESIQHERKKIPCPRFQITQLEIQNMFMARYFFENYDINLIKGISY